MMMIMMTVVMMMMMRCRRRERVFMERENKQFSRERSEKPPRGESTFDTDCQHATLYCSVFTEIQFLYLNYYLNWYLCWLASRD